VHIGSRGGVEFLPPPLVLSVTKKALAMEGLNDPEQRFSIIQGPTLKIDCATTILV
jgi:hypothetical protein